MVIMVDPPYGSAYGFPKPFTFTPSHPSLPGEEYEVELKNWFRDEGYPDRLISEGMLDYCKYIDDNTDTDEELEALLRPFILRGEEFAKTLPGYHAYEYGRRKQAPHELCVDDIRALKKWFLSKGFTY